LVHRSDFLIIIDTEGRWAICHSKIEKVRRAKARKRAAAWENAALKVEPQYRRDKTGWDPAEVKAGGPAKAAAAALVEVAVKVAAKVAAKAEVKAAPGSPERTN
jgi:hypothetical protein